MATSRWMFTNDQLSNTPSRKTGIDADKELSYRQQAANLIQDMGQRLQVEQLCINTAIVYMHRFYMFRSFTRFPRNDMAPACLFLAAKVEEQPRKLEHVIKVTHACLNRDHNTPTPDPKTEAYLEQAQQLVINENILLQTLGFEVTVDHPHTHVVKASTVILAKASKDLSKTSYYLATNSLHMTTWCLQYRPTTVACVCIYLACKWANYKIPKSNEGREWFQYIDPRVTPEIIEDLYNEFLNILDKSPLKLRRKLMGLKGSGNDGQGMEDERQGPSSSSQTDPNRTSTSSHHKHTNHDRHTTPEPLRRAQGEHRDAAEGSKPAHAERNERGDPSRHSDQKHSNDRKDAHRKEIRVGEHKPGVSQHHHNAEKKIPSSHHPDPKLVKREDRREGHSHGQPHRKEVPHSAVNSENQDKASLNEKHKDLPVIKKEPHSNGQSVPAATIAPPVTTLQDIIKMEAEKPSPSVNPEPVTTELLPPTGASQSNPAPAPGMPSRSKTAIDFSQYLKRKEQEKREKEKQQLKMRAESELLSKSFTEGSGKERKHRPPKLDVSLPLPENHLENTKSNNHKDKSERPYNVNIKSPIKPHVSITVKSPIKSSDLKQPKLELSKVHITPEKDGSDPFSVNVNTDPAIRKLMENVKHEQDDSNSQHSHNDEYSSVTVKSEPESRGYPESVQAVVNGPVTVVNIKQEIKEEPKDEPEEGEILEPEISLNPEHSAAPSFRIKELGYDPEKGLESAAALRQAMREESELKTESGSGPNTPIRLKIPTHGSQIGSSPLKIKISTKGLSTDSDHSSGKHSSPHRHKHKHKEKHKHKHSRDKEHRHKHRDKHGHSSSSVSGTATPTNGQPSSLKMSIKLKDIPSPAAVKHKHDKHKTRASISDTALIVGGSNTAEPDRSQPWSMTDLIPKSGSGATPQSPSRKRRRTPTVDKTTELSSQTKAAKMGPHRIRRSSSSHSVVSMELSDGDENQTSNGPQDQNTLSLLNINLMQAIAQTKQKVEIMKRNQAEGKQGALSSSARNSPLDTRPIVNRQQSGFDLEGMMWVGGTETPPLPPSVAPPLPPPEKAKPPPPPFS